MLGVLHQVSAVVERGHERGVTRPVPTTTIAALAWMVERTCMQELADSSPAVQAELADTFTEIIFTALCAW